MDSSMLKYMLAGNTIKAYLMFVGIIIAGIFAVRIFRFIIFRRIKKFSEKTDVKIDDYIVESFRRNIIPLMYVAVLYSASAFLEVSSRAGKWFVYIFLVTAAFLVTRFCISIVIYIVNRYWLVEKEGSGRSNISILINTVIKIIVWAVALLILLDNMGVRISGLVAGMGIGGVAIAFAAQSILRDIFNYFTIFFDRPFEIGDFLVIDKFAGVVEHIGIKTTRLRSLGGEELIFANTDLTGSRVRNYKTMQERRVVFAFGVTYKTPVRKLEMIPALIKQIIESIEGTRFDRAHFQKFGDSSLDFEVVYYVLSGEYNTYMDIQQDINLKIMEALKKLKVEFAYPTRTLFMEKGG
ncbi:MAG TPA: mechanosensitive ion channel family protein [Spirochaetota bacterium]|nr:mechanosensitive ion channel family protein [Spirochaetota bacterium]